MSYLALARKWRPRRFADVVGQEHVVRALVNAIDHDRLHHAFLFTGTRGVGKTTIARILAKALNCEQGVSAEPCGECSSCQAVDAGRFVDLIEVDAASRTKVDDTRELLDNVQYAPTRGRYKIYLIDEVHMLSAHSFNALLKTLEEPPPHVKFLFATTDPQKLPVTVLSRCLQFNLKPLQADQIVDQLRRILDSESIEFDQPALQLVGRFADGSMRDGLSLLDQAIAHGAGTVHEAEVRGMLGTIDDSHLRAILTGLITQDVDAVLAAVAALADRSPDYAAALDEILLNLYHATLAQMAPAALAAKGVHDETVNELAQKLSAEDLQLYYQIGMLGKRDLNLAPDPRSGFEMVFLRMIAFRPTGSARSEVVAGPVRTADTGSSVAPAAKQAAATAGTNAAIAPVTDDWAATVASLEVGGLLKELLSHTLLQGREPGKVALLLDGNHAHLLSKERQQALEGVLSDYFGEPLKLDLRVEAATAETPARQRQRLQDERQQAAESAIHNDPNVQAIMERFDGRVNPATIRPRN